eukprot:sb/3473635/
MTTFTEKLSRFLPASENEFGREIVHDVAERVCGEKIEGWHVDDTLRRVVKNNNGSCPRDLMESTIVELQRRITLEKTLLWDMRILNGTADTPLSMKNVLILFKIALSEPCVVIQYETFMYVSCKQIKTRVFYQENNCFTTLVDHQLTL